MILRRIREQMKAACALALVALPGACQRTSTTPAPTQQVASTPSVTVARISPGEIPCLQPPFTADATLASLKRALGDTNVVEQTFETEGDPVTLAIVYPNDPARRLEIAWRDTVHRANIEMIGPPPNDHASDWTGPNGLRIGAAIAEVQQRNTRAFEIRGLGWDFGGDVADWHGGALSRSSAGCRVNASFGVVDENAMRNPPDEIMGERLVTSDASALRSVALRLWSITYVYPSTEAH